MTPRAPPCLSRRVTSQRTVSAPICWRASFAIRPTGERYDANISRRVATARRPRWRWRQRDGSHGDARRTASWKNVSISPVARRRTALTSRRRMTSAYRRHPCRAVSVWESEHDRRRNGAERTAGIRPSGSCGRSKSGIRHGAHTGTSASSPSPTDRSRTETPTKRMRHWQTTVYNSISFYRILKQGALKTGRNVLGLALGFDLGLYSTLCRIVSILPIMFTSGFFICRLRAVAFSTMFRNRPDIKRWAPVPVARGRTNMLNIKSMIIIQLIR